MLLKKDHDRTDFFLVCPGLSDHIDPFLADPFNPGEFINVFIDNLKGFFSKFSDDPRSQLLSNPRNKTGAQVFLDAFYRSWKHGPVAKNPKLPPKFWVILPGTLHL